MRKQRINIFQDENISQYLGAIHRTIVKEINNQTEDYILNVNETEYINHLVEKSKVPPIEIYFEKITVDSEEKMIPAERFPRFYNVKFGQSYPRDVVSFYLPYSGKREILRYSSGFYVSWITPFYTTNDYIIFEMSPFATEKTIAHEREQVIKYLKRHLEGINNELQRFNDELLNFISSRFGKRKQHFLDKNQFLSSLGVPIRKKADTPKTFSIPAPNQRKPLKPKPVVTEKGFQPEPTLDDTTYFDILTKIQDVGKQFERHPATYSAKEEEELRDHILLILEPHFEGSATGETFNMSGKTDILIRHEGKNVFVAECKFWRGQKGFLEGITQLINNLTWRDSKAALIVFVRNKDFTSVLNKVETTASTHNNYLGFINKKDETWFNYRFHINGDTNREVKLAILLYHIPTK